jgi:hypothetical protein
MVAQDLHNSRRSHRSRGNDEKPAFWRTLKKPGFPLARERLMQVFWNDPMPKQRRGAMACAATRLPALGQDRFHDLGWLDVRELLVPCPVAVG